MQFLKRKFDDAALWGAGALVNLALNIVLIGSISLFVEIAVARPWSEHTQHMSAVSNQIHVAEVEIQRLIKEKNHTHSPTRVAEIMRAIGEKQRAIEKAASIYEEEREHVRYEHPEKNDQLNRQYVRQEVKSLEDLENELGLDAKLDRVKAKVLAKFPIPDRTQTAEAKKFRTRLPASKASYVGEDAPEKITLVK